MSTRITVNAERSYQVIFEPPSIENLSPIINSAKQVALIAPKDLNSLSQEIVEILGAAPNLTNVIIIEVEEGESQKSAKTLQECWNTLGRENFRRTDVIVGLGGGATTDLAGFVAATWLRGVDWIAIPTSLAGMVDAAVGGKTGINTEAGKNLVGAFHSPSLVVVDVNYLQTLPVPELRAGMAEIIKCGFIGDQQILRLIEERDDFYDSMGSTLRELIHRAINVKADIVSQDLKESYLREVLNYGHTLAHAIERREKYLWRHGDAVAVGLAFIANLSNLLGLASQELLNRHLEILARAELRQNYARKAWPELLHNMQNDKKSRNSGVRFVAVTSNYEVTRIEGVSDEVLLAAYERIAE